ncbi:hypothetical protein Q2490_08010 [Myroides odoratimimus]|uniref:hypothetical protein n=1 Tax=Myroides odoratimimus TaxID=76832 RepID=UPI00257536D3|nr:hypothetical protein [Myroides odoratimimus]MDM1442642.1 hypothetical protein [Myroides odoratimimus]MDM1496359.1 hypothetical protein [Myroides odoratimimus]MDO5857228.1 hypothetical protein [Myroides odoratimimus]
MSNTKLLTAAYKLVSSAEDITTRVLPEDLVDIVKWHARFAIGAAFIPIPGVDLLGSASAIWGMYARINSKIGIKFSDNVLKTIASGVATNLLSYGAAVAMGSLLKFIPGIGSVGGTVLMAGTLYAITLASGYIYLNILTTMVKKNGGRINIDSNNLEREIKKYVKENKNEIKDFINEGKEYYNNNKSSLKVSEEEKEEMKRNIKK